ncbi:MAG: carboxypeptidase-like regulatory domain-containing protein [Acidobacteria bacterium]|nr:carboxypeptidase-like regulatory domain-containing protein [Acidobacteriota bacterium]
MPRRSFVVVALALATAASAYSQASTAAINGTLRDSTGSVVPGANLVLKNPATSVETRTTSNEAGYYAFLNVQPSGYTLEVSKAAGREPDRDYRSGNGSWCRY